MNLPFKEYIDAINKTSDSFEEKFLQADYLQTLYKNNFNLFASINNDIVISGDKSMSFFNRGLSLLIGVGEKFGGKDLDMAMGDFNRSILLDEENPLPYYGNAKIWYYRNELAEAIDDAEKAVFFSKNTESAINFPLFLEFLKKRKKECKCIEYNVGKHGTPIRFELEKREEPDINDDWKLIDWSNRFKIRSGSFLREYIKSYQPPSELWFEEHVVTKPSHSVIGRYKWAKGMTIEFIEFEGNKGVQTKTIFQNEIWIRKDTLRNPICWYH